MDVNYHVKYIDYPEYSFRIQQDIDVNRKLIVEMETWCRNNVGVQYATWFRSGNMFQFYKKKDYVAFTLTWSETF